MGAPNLVPTPPAPSLVPTLPAPSLVPTLTVDPTPMSPPAPASLTATPTATPAPASLTATPTLTLAATRRMMAMTLTMLTLTPMPTPTLRKKTTLMGGTLLPDQLSTTHRTMSEPSSDKFILCCSFCCHDKNENDSRSPPRRLSIPLPSLVKRLTSLHPPATTCSPPIPFCCDNQSSRVSRTPVPWFGMRTEASLPCDWDGSGNLSSTYLSPLGIALTSSSPISSPWSLEARACFGCHFPIVSLVFLCPFAHYIFNVGLSSTSLWWLKRNKKIFAAIIQCVIIIHCV